MLVSVRTHRSGGTPKLGTRFFFHEQRDPGEADQAEDLRFRPGDVRVGKKKRLHVMPSLPRRQLSANKNRYLMTALQRLGVNLISDYIGLSF